MPEPARLWPAVTAVPDRVRLCAARVGRSAVAAARATGVHAGGRRAVVGGRTPVRAADRRRHRHGHVCRTPAVRRAAVPEAADGQSADGSGSLQLPLLFLKAGLSGGLRPPSGRQRRGGHGRRPNPRARWSASCGLTCQSRPSMLWSACGPRVIEGSRWKEPSSPLTMPTSAPSGTKKRTCRPTARSSRPRRSHWILPRSSASSAASLGAGSDALPGEAADHRPQHLGDRGGVDLQRVRRQDGADPHRRAPGNSRTPLVAGLVLSHSTVRFSRSGP
jgi:hypothetical protein